MSQHPSLGSGRKQKRHRSVLKRYERLKHMKEKDMWDEGKSAIFGLPKIKVLKFRVKKEKIAEEAPAEAAATGAEAGAQTKEAAGAQEIKEKASPKKEKKQS